LFLGEGGRADEGAGERIVLVSLACSADVLVGIMCCCGGPMELDGGERRENKYTLRGRQTEGEDNEQNSISTISFGDFSIIESPLNYPISFSMTWDYFVVILMVITLDTSTK
jgi:hypothetical protein